jgi:hypothetical protein
VGHGKPWLGVVCPGQSQSPQFHKAMDRARGENGKVHKKSNKPKTLTYSLVLGTGNIMESFVVIIITIIHGA